MIPPFPPGGRFHGVDPDERALIAFEDLCEGGQTSLEEFWSKLEPSRPLTLLSSLVKIELIARFKRGERPRAAEYLTRFPRLTENSDRVLSIVYEEFCLLEEAGDAPDSDDFCNGYSRWRDSLHSQLVYHRELSQIAGVEPPKLKFPAPGDQFSTYRLRSILGTGGAATVYLATEDELGDRRVVLKISGSVGREPSILANLNHRGIVPILAIARSEENELRAFSMPYRPGVTLEELIRRIGRGKVPRSAKAIWDALTPQVIDGEIEPEGDRAGWSGFPIHGTYPQAVAWIGLMLTNALGYLHQRKVLHRDIKPANILLAFEEGPQLLDFNLADDRNAAEHAHAALKGGTLPYMAPEQLQAFVEPSRWSDVESPADLYSLGLVLRELVTGQPPELPSRQLSLPRTINALLDRRLDPETSSRIINPEVPPSLDAIISKCLASHPVDRYKTAEDLTVDLQRFLQRRRLKFAPNRSWLEQSRNLFFRNRSAILGAAFLSLVFGLSRIGGYDQPRIEADPSLRVAIQDYQSGDKTGRQRARFGFQQLHETYPGSALPLLYLSLIWQADDSSSANDYMNRAITRKDAEHAIETLLAHDPNSTTLLMAKGWILFDQKKDPTARLPILEVLKTNPDHHGALVLLGRIELGVNHVPEAIHNVEKAIQILSVDEARLIFLIKARKLLCMIRTIEMNTRLDSGQSSIERHRAIEDIESISANLKELRHEWDKLGMVPEADHRDVTLSFYESVIHSGRGVLAAEAGHDHQAQVEFHQAREQFQHLWDLKSTKLEINEGFRQELSRERKLLAHREVRRANSPSPTH